MRARTGSRVRGRRGRRGVTWSSKLGPGPPHAPRVGSPTGDPCRGKGRPGESQKRSLGVQGPPSAGDTSAPPWGTRKHAPLFWKERVHLPGLILLGPHRPVRAQNCLPSTQPRFSPLPRKKGLWGKEVLPLEYGKGTLLLPERPSS